MSVSLDKRPLSQVDPEIHAAIEAEKKRLEKELATAEDKLEFINKKLNNPGFVNKAPEKVVQQNKDDAAKLEEKIAQIKKSIEEIAQQ